MKSHQEHNRSGGVRFVLEEPLPVGKFFMHIGRRVKVVGPGMAGMPEVELEDGSTEFAFPHELKPCEQ